MASAFVSEDLSCPVCCDIPCDPVVLPCGHIICQPCLPESWTTEESPGCPVCMRRSSRSDDLVKTPLKTLNRSEDLCSRHDRELELFCLTDQQPFCLVCHISGIHINHSFCSKDEAMSCLKAGFRERLPSLQRKLKIFQEIQQNYIDTAEYIKNQAYRTEMVIQERFKKLYRFLRTEEVERRLLVKKEEEEKSQIMEAKIEEMSKEITLLSDSIRAIETKLETEDISFLQDLMATLDRPQTTPEGPEKISGALINVANHLQNLSFKVWLKMQNIVLYTPVTLDPNTSHPDLFLSEYLTSVTYQEEQLEKLPSNPERFQSLQMVLGSEGFISGTHCWDVEVGDNGAWAVGVITESSQRERPSVSENQFWEVSFYGDRYEALSLHEPLTVLTLVSDLRKIRVQLDYDEGRVCFSDPETETALHTFESTFVCRVFPYFLNDSEYHSLKILPVKLSVEVKQNGLLIQTLV